MIKQITVFDRPQKPVETTRGIVGYWEWCNKEVVRLRRKGVLARTVRDRNGDIAVFSADGKDELEVAERAFA